MAKITFILGGARSGKSTFAKTLAERYEQVAFIATCEPRDLEMRQRIKLHKKYRPGHWKTYEAPKDVLGCLKEINKSFDCILIDCLTLLISNLMLSGSNQRAIEGIAEKMAAILKKSSAHQAIIVSNEVGLGIVPQTEAGRRFRDIAGRINQIIASHADEVFFTVSAIPIKIKGEYNG